MASSQPVPDEAAWRYPILPAIRPGSEVFASQSWNWLTERFGYPPQVRLVFDEELAKLAAQRENFEDL
jgi:hypothetical protein